MSDDIPVPEISIIKYSQSEAYKRAQKTYRLKNIVSMKKKQKEYYERNKIRVRERQKQAYIKKKDELKNIRNEKKKLLKLNKFQEITKMIKNLDFDNNEELINLSNSIKIYVR
jgi:ribosomal protein L3